MTGIDLAAVTRRDVVLASAAAAFAGQAATASTLNESSLGPLKRAPTAVLDIGYHELGPRHGPAVLLLHGFPYDVHSYSKAAPMLAARGFRVLVPYLRGHGPTRFRDAGVPHSGQQAALGQDLVDLMDALGIEHAVLAGYDWGGRAACVVTALWPDRCVGLVSVNNYLIQDIARAHEPLPASVERGFWYQFYFLTGRGRAGLMANRNEIARIMWRENSPQWRFDDETFALSAAAFENPDYVDVVIHSYRHRLGAAPGLPEYAALEARLALLPTIKRPSVTLDGTADGVVPATDGSASARFFSGPRVHRRVRGAGHNLPQETPDAFVSAVVDVARMGA